MRTKAELLDILNPQRVRNKFTIIPVKYNRVIHTSGVPINSTWVSFEEIHYDANGDFMGTTSHEAYPVSGNDIDDLKIVINQLTKALDKPIITEDELKLIRS